MNRVIERFAALPQVRAIALAGSQATSQAGAASDYDIYIYSDGDLPVELRLTIGQEFSPNAQIVDFWGAGMEWDDPETDAHIDTVYFDVQWMEDQIERVMVRCEPSLGYSTCFLHTVCVSRPLYDPHGWLVNLQQHARQPYPDELAQRIIALNLPVLRDSFSSYRSQLAKAASRGDMVSLNHRVAAFLASIFDILFAINKTPHPGEKRLLDLAEHLCPVRPASLRADVEALLRATSVNATDVVPCADRLVDSLEILLR